jgi:hypothetical protein
MPVKLDGSLGILWKGKPLLLEEIQVPKKDRSDPHAALRRGHFYCGLTLASPKPGICLDKKGGWDILFCKFSLTKMFLSQFGLFDFETSLFHPCPGKGKAPVTLRRFSQTPGRTKGGDWCLT